MLCDRLPGYSTELEKIDEATLKEVNGKGIPDIFEIYFLNPLSKLLPPTDGLIQVIVIDALDELPAASKGKVVNLITNHFISLPSWIRLFITSRNEENIKRVLTSKFDAYDLVVTAEKNLQDLRAFLRYSAKPYFGGFDVGALKTDIINAFGIHMRQESLEVLKINIENSISTYDDAIAIVAKKDPQGLKSLTKLPDIRPPDAELRQSFFSLQDGLDKSAKVRKVLLHEVADEWEVFETHGLTKLSRPVSGKTKKWLSQITGLQVIDPGLKGVESATRKLKTEYDGDATRLKDLARITFKADRPEALITTLTHLQDIPGWKMASCKNKYASPTPLGYRDLNTCFRVPISGTESVLCEVQFHLCSMLEVKEKAHVFYEKIRVELPKMCEGTGVNPDKVQGYIKSRLDNSALDAAVEKMEEKAGGLFIYASLMNSHIKNKVARQEETRLTFEDITALPNGLDDIYQENFIRLFPKGAQDARWQKYKGLIAIIATAKEPCPVALAKEILKWSDDEEKITLSELSLLFPVRDQQIHVLHKTVTDWLFRSGREEEAFYVSLQNKIEAQERLAHTCLKLVEERKYEDASLLSYPLKFALIHACEVAGRKPDLRRRAVDVLFCFNFLYKSVKNSPVKLLQDVRLMQEMMKKVGTSASDDRPRAVSLMQSALQLSMQGLLFDYKYVKLCLLC